MILIHTGSPKEGCLASGVTTCSSSMTIGTFPSGEYADWQATASKHLVCTVFIRVPQHVDYTQMFAEGIDVAGNTHAL